MVKCDSVRGGKHHRRAGQPRRRLLHLGSVGTVPAPFQNEELRKRKVNIVSLGD